MKHLTVRDLNRRTASVLDALERGESFAVQRSGKVIGFLTQTRPEPERKPDWRAHFARLHDRSKTETAELLSEFEAERRRARSHEAARPSRATSS